ncbi:Mss4-like protein [Amylocarpus encephaloides]|uniref:Mss4-like protein n=1 Tax=Amylocarpus encephaloides TaxID=45428 RepID=A0A9P8C7J9_9HELO|nr:Mss4-like protein [Amylocarpus encephaloides]
MSTTTPTPSLAQTTVPANLRTYQGGCHCGNVKFSVTLPEIKSANECTCSICSRKGYAWVFPREGGLVFEEGKGVESLRGYEFAGRRMVHRFCPTCGNGVMGQRHHWPAWNAIGVNARLLADVDVATLPIDKFDGAALPPHYDSHLFHAPWPAVAATAGTTSHGSCHCGATTLGLAAKLPLPDGQRCSCDLCYSSAAKLTCPEGDEVAVVTSGLQPLTNYKGVLFCPRCGVYVSGEAGEGGGGTGEDKEMAACKGLGKMRVNVRCFEGWGAREKEVEAGEDEGSC